MKNFVYENWPKQISQTGIIYNLVEYLSIAISFVFLSKLLKISRLDSWKISHLIIYAAKISTIKSLVEVFSLF